MMITSYRLRRVALYSSPLLFQGDLSEDDVMMLDSGKNVFLWFGKNASEVERKLSVKSAQVRTEISRGIVCVCVCGVIGRYCLD